MPIYMDVHIAPGVTAKAVAEAHRMDLLYQEGHGCKCMTYWIDENRGTVFCLIEAPEKGAVEEMHRQAHGLIPHKIIEVSNNIVESFLGRIYDPSDAVVSADGLKVFSDPSFRILMVTKIADPVLLHHKYGDEKTKEWLKRHNEVIRKNLVQYGGREVEHSGAGFIVSFSSAAKAVACALAVQSEMPDADTIEFKTSINAGEPVADSNSLFGDTIQLAAYMCAIVKSSQVGIASAVKELIAKDHFQNRRNSFLSLSPQDETLLASLFNKLEAGWNDPDFDIPEYCQAMAMSKSQLYRKTILLTGFSPNILLKEYRLEKAKELMKKRRYSISQITFEAGFSSPSYFTKCFKKKYGILPMEYIDLLH